MTTTSVPSPRSTALDRVVRWALDVDGDTYGDERERLRWYEGIATAASLQWLAVPWAAAVLVWPLGRPAVLPLAVVLTLMYVPMLVCQAYMRRRRVDTSPRTWRLKTILHTAAGVLPYVVFLVGALDAYQAPDHSTAIGAAVGGVFGGTLGTVALALRSRRQRRLEVAAAGDDD
jgi:membrane associated rhomboid family serine protease